MGKRDNDKYKMTGLDACLNCENPAEHMHHVVPKTLGGKEGANLVPLCGDCHNLVHDAKHLNLKELQKAGIERAKREGKYKGRKRTIDRLAICYWNTQGLSTYKIANKMRISRMTVHRCLNEEGLAKVKVTLKSKEVLYGQT